MNINNNKKPKFIFYCEGASEYNFIKAYLITKNLPVTEDIQAFRNTNNYKCYLNDCGSDSAIIPALEEDYWWINEFVESTVSKIIIVSDLNHLPCYTESKQTLITRFNCKINQTNIFFLINSKPKLEYEYFEKPEIIKHTIKKLYKKKFKKNCKTLKNEELIDSPETNLAESLKRFSKKNIQYFDKREFSEHYFNKLFSNKQHISISKRLEEILAIAFTICPLR